VALLKTKHQKSHAYGIGRFRQEAFFAAEAVENYSESQAKDGYGQIWHSVGLSLEFRIILHKLLHKLYKALCALVRHRIVK